MFVEDLAAVLSAYITVDEPYRLLEDEGYCFAGMPCLDDFEERLAKSIELMYGSEKNVIFDRCPLDFMAYLLTCSDSDGFDLGRWLPKIEAAVSLLALIVFIPLESKASIVVPACEDNLVQDCLYNILILFALTLFGPPATLEQGHGPERRLRWKTLNKANLRRAASSRGPELFHGG